jgi:hypothetical protein
MIKKMIRKENLFFIGSKQNALSAVKRQTFQAGYLKMSFFPKKNDLHFIH